MNILTIRSNLYSAYRWYYLNTDVVKPENHSKKRHLLGLPSHIAERQPTGEANVENRNKTASESYDF